MEKKSKKAVQTYTLLIWEQVPETAVYFLIPDDVAQKCRDVLEKAHGHYANTTEENAEVNVLNLALSKADADTVPLSLAHYQWKEVGPIRGVTITHVYVAGFYL